MPDAVSADDLLDEWEEAREQTPNLSADDFIEQYGVGLDAAVLEEFLVRAKFLESLDIRLNDAQQSNCQVYPMSSPLDLTAGACPVEGYTLVARLGGGGFGEVWKAVAPGGFQVALKFVQLGTRTGKTEERSLEVIRDIRHPHLISIFGSWRVKNCLVIAMELADRTILDRFHEARQQHFVGIPHSELLSYMEEAAQAIDFLNEPDDPNQPRIQHRDIKPRNILLTSGSVKVSDFGLARIVHAETTDHTGSMTLAYAAPECLNGTTSRRSDQYSLAVTYYQLRTGALPFDGTPAQIVDGHRQMPPDLSRVIGAERPVIAKALAKQPNQRWTSCGEFVAALRSVDTRLPSASSDTLTTPEPEASKAHRYFRHRRAIISVGILTAIAVANRKTDFFGPYGIVSTFLRRRIVQVPETLKDLDQFEMAIRSRMLASPLREDENFRDALFGLMAQFQVHVDTLSTGLNNAEYFASFVYVAAYFGLIGEHKKEQQLLRSFWFCFINNVRPDQVLSVSSRMQEIMKFEGTVLAGNIDSGTYELLGPAGPDIAFIRKDLRGVLTWPKYSTIWPFGPSLRASMVIEPSTANLRATPLEDRLPRFPHEYVTLAFNYDLAIEQKSHQWSEYETVLSQRMSVLRYYADVDGMPPVLRKELDQYALGLISQLEQDQSEKFSEQFASEAVSVLAILERSYSLPGLNNRARRLSGQFSRHITKTN